MGVPAGTRFGPYAIIGPIGAGGMGEVYRASDTDLKREVAIKILPQAFVDDAARIARFQREAELLASLNHPNIAQIYGLEREGSTTALILELVEGPTLADRITEGALPASEALDIALQIAAALEVAHGQGIVHRDLKPANVKLRPDGTVKVLDFGIAKALEVRTASGPQKPALTTPAMTQQGLVLGTAAYMAPEQARGKAVDQRADIWAFGCVLYEMLTGQCAFGGEDVPITLARVLANDTDLGSLPKSISPAVRHTLKLCLEKDPRKRIADIRDVRLALEGGFESSVRAGVVDARPLWRRTLPIAAGVAGGVVLAAVVLWMAQPAAPPPLAAAAPLPVTRFVVTPPATAPLTSLGGYDMALSLDGKRLAYFGMNPETRGVALYLRELDSLESRLIPGTEIDQPAATMNPFFSPDGGWIGLYSPGQGILRFSLEGEPPQKIVDAPTPTFLSAAWASDDTIIYSSGPQLWRVSASGGMAEALTPAAEDSAAMLAAPHLLPGERAVLYGHVEGDYERVAVLDLATGEQKMLVDGGQNPYYLASGHIAFARGTTLMAVPFDLAELAVTGEAEAVLQGVRHPAANNAADFALSANGTLVYVPASESDRTGRAVVWVDRAGAVIDRAIDELVPVARNPRLSPDGTRLLLTTDPTNSGDLWVYDLGGRPPVPLATAADNLRAVWSPDGAQVAFGQFRGTQSNILITLADGSQREPQPLRAEGLRGVPSVWSRDGELIFVQQGPGTLDGILATPISATGELREIVVTDLDAEYDPDLSTDGRWLAYVSTRTGSPEIWVKAYPDGVPQRVSRSGGYEPRWSADGRELFYIEGDMLMATTVATEGAFSFATPAPLFTVRWSNPAPGAHSYDVAADGRIVMVEELSGADAADPTSIVVVQNWSEELTQRLPRTN